MIIKLLLVWLLTVWVTGCGDDALNFQIRFEEIHGLKTHDRIIFDNDPVGIVKKVTYTDKGIYLVEASIESEFAHLATENSIFFINSDPIIRGQMAIEMIRTETGGPCLKEGATIDGKTKFSALFNRMQNSFEKKFFELESEFNEFLQDLRCLSESDQLKEIEKELDRIILEMNDLSTSLKLKMETEILPLLKEKIENLRQRLKELGREDELEPIDDKIITISNNLKT